MKTKLDVKTQRKVVSDFPGFFTANLTPPYYRMALKRHNFCSICPPVRLKSYVRQKFFLCQAVPFFWVCPFPTIFYPFFQKWRIFRVYSVNLVEKQTNWNFFSGNEKFEHFRCVLMSYMLIKLKNWLRCCLPKMGRWKGKNIFLWFFGKNSNLVKNR